MDLARNVCGIGASTAIEFARLGADVAICGTAIHDKGRDVARQIQSLGRRCLLDAVDVSRSDQAAAWVERAIAALGGIEVLVHSAEGPRSGEPFRCAGDGLVSCN
jgi:NAD(P)-dependent dehydrogenase (short-subunit alcohol dehydrogenase family)